MQLTFADTDLIRKWEGHSLKAYADPATKAEPYTISYGLTGPWVKKDTVLTQAESDSKFMEYIAKFCKDLDGCLKVPVTKNQYIAMLSLMWNIGPANFKASTLLKKVNAKDFKGAAEEFPKWNKAAGKIMQGLVNRRAAEKAVFLTA